MIGKQHDQPVDPDPFSGGRRHPVLEGAEKVLVDEMRFFIARLTLSRLAFKPFTLVQRIVQLGKGIRDFSSGNVELEAIRQARVRILPSCERRNFDRVIGNESRLCKFGSTVSSKISLTIVNNEAFGSTGTFSRLAAAKAFSRS